MGKTEYFENVSSGRSSGGSLWISLLSTYFELNGKIKINQMEIFLISCFCGACEEEECEKKLKILFFRRFHSIGERSTLFFVIRACWILGYILLPIYCS